MQRALGQGAAGTVYLARDPTIGRDVAIKVVTADGLSRERFQQEARLLGQLDHEHIVKVYDAGEHDGTPFLVLEYVPGQTLRQLADLPLDDWVAILARVADACAAAHARGVVHRDLKPENVLIAERGPVVADFGVAKLLAEGDDVKAKTRTGMLLGTPAYMAPEQASGSTSGIGPWTDVYALGAILYERLTGRVPFEGERLLEVAVRIASADPTAPRVLDPSVPRTLEAIALRCLAKEPGERYPDMADLARALRRWRTAEEELQGPSPWIALAVAAPLLLVAAGGVALMKRPARPAPEAAAATKTPPERAQPRAATGTPTSAPIRSAAARLPAPDPTHGPTPDPTPNSTPTVAATPSSSPPRLDGTASASTLRRALADWASGAPGSNDPAAWEGVRAKVAALAKRAPRLSGKERERAYHALAQARFALRDVDGAARDYATLGKGEARAWLAFVRLVQCVRRANAESVGWKDPLLKPETRAFEEALKRCALRRIPDPQWKQFVRTARNHDRLEPRLPLSQRQVSRALNYYLGLYQNGMKRFERAALHLKRAGERRGYAPYAREQETVLALARVQTNGPKPVLSRLAAAAEAAPLDPAGLRFVSTVLRQVGLATLVERWSPDRSLGPIVERLRAALGPTRSTPIGATAWADAATIRWRLVLGGEEFRQVETAFRTATPRDATWQLSQGKAIALALRHQVVLRFPALRNSGETPLRVRAILGKFLVEAERRAGRGGAQERKVLRRLYPKIR